MGVWNEASPKQNAHNTHTHTRARTHTHTKEYELGLLCIFKKAMTITKKKQLALYLISVSTIDKFKLCLYMFKL